MCRLLYFTRMSIQEAYMNLRSKIEREIMQNKKIYMEIEHMEQVIEDRACSESIISALPKGDRVLEANQDFHDEDSQGQNIPGGSVRCKETVLGSTKHNEGENDVL